MRASALATIVIALWGTSPAQKVQFNPIGKPELLEKLKDAPDGDRERALRVKTMFAAAGCSGPLLQEQPVTGASGPNIICELRGHGAGSVIVGARYEPASPSGALDHWNSAALLPALYHGLLGHKRQHSYIFVAFAGHGAGSSGAAFFVAHRSQSDPGSAEAMVNLDVLGLSPTKIWSSRSDKELVQDLLTMAYALKLPASQIDLTHANNSDAVPFTQQQIPNITIHSLTQENLAASIATPFRPDNYYDTYRLLCGYLAYLDAILKPQPHAGNP